MGADIYPVGLRLLDLLGLCPFQAAAGGQGDRDDVGRSGRLWRVRVKLLDRDRLQAGIDHAGDDLLPLQRDPIFAVVRFGRIRWWRGEWMIDWIERLAI